MTNYATIADIKARYGDLTEDEQAKAELLLEDATALIIAAGGTSAAELTEEQAAAYRAVCCAMVHRVMISPAWGPLGATQHSNTAGPFTESFTFQNPNGDMYLTKAERKTLGIPGMVMGTITPIGVKES